MAKVAARRTPTMKTSPWAKLISRTMPYTIVPAQGDQGVQQSQLDAVNHLLDETRKRAATPPGRQSRPTVPVSSPKQDHSPIQRPLDSIDGERDGWGQRRSESRMFDLAPACNKGAAERRRGASGAERCRWRDGVDPDDLVRCDVEHNSGLDRVVVGVEGDRAGDRVVASARPWRRRPWSHRRLRPSSIAARSRFVAS